MKRDLWIIKAILSKIKKSDSHISLGKKIFLKFPDDSYSKFFDLNCNDEVLFYYFELILQAGFIKIYLLIYYTWKISQIKKNLMVKSINLLEIQEMVNANF